MSDEISRGGESQGDMSLTTCHVSVSLDGYIAGPDQSEDHPLGVDGLRVHAWHLGQTGPIDQPVVDDLLKQRGAYVMGRNMFGPVRGEWTGDWRGWWGDEPPYHAPVYVLTHHARPPVEMDGGTTFHFVTDGFAAAYAAAREAAGDREVGIAGGASTIRQAFAAGVIDQITLDIAPVLLGSGERLFDGIDDPGLTPVDVVHSPHATHVRYRVGSSTTSARGQSTSRT
jgi:dihydrofolate reductase